MTYFLFPGYKRNDLTILSYEGKNSKRKKVWKCKCLCGKETQLTTNEIVGNKATKSCGKCEWHILHKNTYISWMSMKSRCDDINNKDYENYGGRGIKYCKEWGLFVPFYIDMGDPPYDGITGERLSLDRIRVNEDYEKGNCKWSTRSEQQLNKRMHFRKEMIRR